MPGSGTGGGESGNAAGKAGAFDRVQKKLDERQSEHEQQGASSDRGFRRWPFRIGAVAVTIGVGGRSSTPTSMVTRDISPQGVGLLHNAYVHIGSRVTVELPTISGGIETLDGEVVRCIHVAGTAHQVGVNFDREIDPSHFEPSILASQRFAHERKLSGTVLHVEDCMIDRMLIAKQLREAGLKVTSVGTLEEARKALKRNWSLILVDVRLPDGRGTDLANELRAACDFTPLVILTADDTPAAQETYAACPADAVLFKPTPAKTLRNAIASMLKAPSRDGTMVSSLRPGEEGYAIVDSYVTTLREQGKAMHDLWMSRNADGCAKLGAEIAASAPPYGFAPIGAEARRMCELLTTRGWNAETSAAIRRVIALCQQVRTASEADAADAA